MSSLRSLANEGTSSAGNMDIPGPSDSVKRKRSESNCHQCHRNDKGTVSGCTKCKKKYCITCITRWYTTLNVTDVVEACPVCRNICNCAACLKPDAAIKNMPIPDLKLNTTEKINHSYDIIRLLRPFLKQFVAEENMEKEAQARIEGLSVEKLCLFRSHFSHDDNILCNNCKSSTLAVYRNCLKCFFKLCMTCCFEIRDGSLRRNPQYIEWVVNNNGNIVCPPKSLGGCGNRNLDLVSKSPINWVLELLGKIETIGYGVGYTGLRQQNFVENDMCCPTSLAVRKDDLEHIQWHLQRGEPVVVHDAVNSAIRLSWEPMVMWRACRKPRKPGHQIKDFRVFNYLSKSEETIAIHHFCKGYSEGLFDSEGRLKVLKLEDWPPIQSFQELLPRHFVEFLICLPFMLYTHPQAGYLNMSTSIPTLPPKQELGPKMSMCYGVGHEQKSNAITMLHYALADKVDILMHTASICHDQLPSTSAERPTKTEGGAIWDIFRRQDVPKLEEYLRKHARELTHMPLPQQLVHPVHEKAFYLNAEHKINLKEEYGIKPWTLVQKLGDAIVVPAGCPHQITYLKSCTSVASNFVAPESIGECIRLSAESRRLPQNHRYKEDKLQVKQMTLHAISQAVEYLATVTPDVSISRVGHSDVQAKEPSLSDLILMKETMTTNLSKLVMEGHQLEPHLRDDLYKSVQNFLNNVDKAIQEKIIGASSS